MDVQNDEGGQTAVPGTRWLITGTDRAILWEEGRLSDSRFSISLAVNISWVNVHSWMNGLRTLMEIHHAR